MNENYLLRKKKTVKKRKNKIPHFNKSSFTDRIRKN